jgi:two-component system, chemotaxis family, chemotaxis protein CheY
MTGKILIVDDSSLSRRTIRRILETEGLTVHEASDGLNALEVYFLEKPDAVLLDLVMTGMYGLDVLAKLREMDPNARVMIVSADIQSSTRTLAEEAGACAIIHKPVVASDLVATLRNVLAGGHPLGTQ